MRALVGNIALVIAALSGCAPVEMRAQIDRPTGESYVSTGDIALRVQRTDDLPNVVGRADLFGRTRDRGFTELRYMGTNAAGNPVFRRRDVDIVTNETTMSRTGGFSSFYAQGSVQRTGNFGSAQYNAAGNTFIPPTANVGALPPDTVEIALDLQQSRIVTVGRNGIEVIDATPSGVKYRAY